MRSGGATEEIYERVWEQDSYSVENTVMIHINRLRRRFENNPDFEIITVRGLGYKAVMKE